MSLAGVFLPLSLSSRKYTFASPPSTAASAVLFAPLAMCLYTGRLLLATSTCAESRVN